MSSHRLTRRGRFSAHRAQPTTRRSEAHWAQPCIRVGKFTGTGADATADKYAYIKKSFVYLDGKRAMMPTQGWATEARYIPGAGFGPGRACRAPMSTRARCTPMCRATGLIGCFSGDDSMIFATAFEPYQELFQGVIRCLHSDFRLGGLAPGETLDITGKNLSRKKRRGRAAEALPQRFPHARGTASAGRK